MDKDKLKVVQLPVGNLMDIPGMLRRIADSMESGAVRMPRSIVMVCEIAVDSHGFELDIYQPGAANDIARIVGLLHMTCTELTVDMGIPITDYAG